MSPAASGDGGGPLRLQYGAELEQLALQTEVMGVLVETNLERMRQVLRTGDRVLADVTVANDPHPTYAVERLVAALHDHDGPDAVPAALRTMVAGQALDRIADHAAIMGARVRYLITGDPAHLAAEV